ncbi:MAG: hypothetical protein IJ002_05295 [Clostridia bacterium]|nr:hypothetical protein [Clostridia bacterium]
MKTTLKFTFFLIVAVCLCISAFATETTVYLDGTGQTNGAETTIEAAVDALPDEGGHIIVCGDTATTNTAITLNAKSGKVKVTAINGAKFTIARTLKFSSEFEFDDIELVSSSSMAFIYAKGNKLTIGENVTTSKTSDSAKWFALFGGNNTGTEAYDTHLVVKAGTFRDIYGGNYQGTVNGTSTVEVSGVTVTGTLSAKNYSGTFNGTSTLTIDLCGNKTVSAGTFAETPTTILVEDGYEAVLADGTYSQRLIPTSRMSKVYVADGGSGDGSTASTPIDGFAYAYDTLDEDGGEIILVGDTTVAGSVLLEEKNGDVTFSSENGAKLILSGSIALAQNTNGKAVTFDLPIKADGGAIYGGFRNVTFDENCTVSGALDLYGGTLSSSAEDADNNTVITTLPYTITVKNGTFRNFAGGICRAVYTDMIGSVAATLTVDISGGSFTDSFSLSGGSILADNVNLTISGGDFACPIYVRSVDLSTQAKATRLSPVVASDRTYYAMDGDVTINISGGNFTGGLISAYNANVAYTQVLRGNFTVKITGGTFSNGTVLDATQVKAYDGVTDKIATVTYTDGYDFTCTRFDTVNGEAVTYDEPLRIAFVGDSITEGYGSSAPLVTSYPAVFAALTKEAGKDVVVANYGVSSSGLLETTSVFYPSRIAYTLLIEETDADYIVVGLGTNDHLASSRGGLRAAYIENYTEFIETLAALPETDKIFMTSAIISGTKAIPGNSQLRIRSVIAPLQRQIASGFAKTDADKYIFVDLFGLTLPCAKEGTLLGGDRVHPKDSGYSAMGNAIYDAIFNGKTEPDPDYHRTDIYLSENGTEFGSGTEEDPTSRIDIAFSMIGAGESATVHISGNVSHNAQIVIPLGAEKITLVGEGEGAVLELLGDGDTIWVNSDIKVDNLTLKGASASTIIGNYHNVEFTDTTTLAGTWSFFAGVCSYDVAGAVIPYDTEATTSSADDCTVILSGTGSFSNFALGNYRVANVAPIGTYSGNLTATVGDGYSVSGTIVGAVGQNYLTGSITASLPYGFTCDDYASVGTVADPIVYDESKNTGTVTISNREALTNLDVVFVSGSGTGDGRTPTSPTSDIAMAYTMLGEDGGTVVFVGEYTTSETVNFPAHTAKVKLTSVYGTDYREAADASIRYNGTGFIKFNGPTEIDGLTVKLDKSSAGFCANLHPLTIGYDFAVVNTDGTDTYRMYLVGGQNGEEKDGALAATSTNEIKVFSGKFIMVSAFSRNIALEHSGTVTVTIGGTADVRDLYFGALSTGAKGGTGIVYLEENAKVTNAYLSGNTVGMTGSAILHMEDSASVTAFKNSSATYFANGTRELYYTSTVTLPSDYASHFDTVVQTDYVEEAPRIVYVDGTGTTEGAYATLQEAVEALNDDGGNVIVCGDTTVSGVVELAAKNGKIKITGQNGAKLTIARTFKITSEVEFDNIELVSTSDTYGFIYAQGNKLTIGQNVITSKTDSAKWFSVLGGSNSGTVEYNSHLVIKAGTYNVIYGGNNQGTFTGTATVEISNATVTGTLSAMSYSGTFNGTSTLTVDLRGNKTVSAGTFKETPTTIFVDDGYEAVLADGTYSQREIEEPQADPKTVYVDGTGATDGAYTSLEAALSDMPGGGTVIISGDTEINADTTFAKTAEVLITSVYGDEDYRDTAAIKIAADITLGGDTIFKDVVIERTKLASGQLYIVAAGNDLTFDTGVVCLNYTGMQWPSLVGGNKTAAYNGDAHITIKSGHFRNIFGGNYTGTFTGNTYVDISGGVFDYAVCGGSYNGNFSGDSHLTFGGEAALLYGASAPAGVIGGNLGSGSTAYTFDGDVYLKICGNSAITGNVIGGSRASNTTHSGNINIEFADNAFVFYSTYAGGYAANVEGNTKTVFNGGDMQGDMFGGCYSGTVTGNTEIIINSGKVCYYKTNLESGWSEPAGEKSVYGGGAAGSTVTGNTSVTVNGGRIFGNVYGEGIDSTATVSGTSAVKATAGMIFGKIANADNAVIDLSAGGELSIGVTSDVNSLIGGGKLVLAAGVTLGTDTLSGTTELSINGLPLPQKYLTVKTVEDGAQINYTAQDDETLVYESGTYTIDFEGAYPLVTLTVNYADGCVCRLRPGKVSSGAYLTPVSSTSTSSVYTVEPGLYTAKISYNGSHYYLRYMYVYGRSEAQEVSCVFPAASDIGYEGLIAGRHTDEINELYYNDNDINGFYIPDSPYFNNRPGSTVFTTNEEANAFIDAKDAECDYMYAFYPTKTTVRGYDFPVVIFTKDEVKEGATIEDIATVVGKEKGRDIIMITCGVHGNEPSGAEGGLALISELCGEYGSTVFDGTNVGAVVILPRMNPEGLYAYIRNTTAEVINPNLNRDYMTASDVATSTYAYIYDLFMPTMTMDCHESHIQPVWSDGEILTDNYDVGISYFTSASSIHGDAKAVLSGNLGATNEYTGQKICDDAIDYLKEEYGLRSYYFPQGESPSLARNYSNHLGAYGYTIEIPGIWGAEEHFSRRVFTQVTAMKTLIGFTLNSNGTLAADVAEAREKTALSAQEYDARRPIVVEQAESRVPTYGFTWNNPIVGADGTVRVSDNLVWQDPHNVAIKYRTLPTAYVISADVANIDAVLARLDTHNITYKKLDAGTAMTLQQYSGTTTTAILSAAKVVTFDNGAYIIPVDGYKAYITAYLFEPDNTDVTEGVCTFSQVGDLAVSDIYRSTESFIAAKMGVKGTYIEVATDGKTVANAVVDGVTYESVATEGENAYVVRAEDTVVLNFTDGTSKTYVYRDIPGDIDRDGSVTIKDILKLIRVVVNNQTIENGDLNGDGNIGLIDVIRVMKIVAQ